MSKQRISKIAGLLAATLLSAATTPAEQLVQLKQTPLPPTDILVTGRPEPTAKQVERQATAISRMGDAYKEPLARFSDRICPGIIGLPVDAAGIMVDRIRFDAERAGATLVPGDTCEPNILVVFVRDGATGVRELMRTKGYLFADLDTAEAKEIENEKGAARAWNITRLRTRAGEPERPTLFQGPLSVSGPPTLLGPMRVTAVPSSNSHIFLASQTDIIHSVVVIDIAAIDGMSVVQIADYAAMRALAKTRSAPGDAAASTILNLFDPAAQHPYELTAFDLAYLHSLYEAGSNLPAAVKIAGVSRALSKIQASTVAEK